MGIMENVMCLETTGAGIMENVLFLEPPAAGIMERVLFFGKANRGNDGKRAARRGNNGKRNVFGAAGAGIMENVMFLEPPGAGIMDNVCFGSRQAREWWKT